MPAFTYERAWHFSFNNAFTPATALEESNYTAWAMLSMMVGGLGAFTLGLWTIYTTSDGTAPGTGVTGDGVDHLHLLGAFTSGDWLHAAAASPHSWAVLRSPTMNGTNFYLLLSFDSASTGNCSFKMALNPFVGGTNTANPVPSPDDSWILQGTAPVGHVGGNTNAHRYAACLSETGDFIWFWTRAGQGKAEGVMAIIAPVGCHPKDQIPIWAVKGWFATDQGFRDNITLGIATRDFKNNVAGISYMLYTSGRPHGTLGETLTGKTPDLPLFVIGTSTTAWWAR